MTKALSCILSGPIYDLYDVHSRANCFQQTLVIWLESVFPARTDYQSYIF